MSRNKETHLPPLCHLGRTLTPGRFVFFSMPVNGCLLKKSHSSHDHLLDTAIQHRIGASGMGGAGVGGSGYRLVDMLTRPHS